MRYRQELKPMVGIGALLGVGWVLIAFTTVRAIQSDASLSSRAVGVAIPIALALTLFAGAAGIVVYGLADHAFRIAVWTCLGALVVTMAVVLNIVGLDIVRPDFTLAFYMLTTAAAAGATIGILIGLYDAHQQGVQANLTETRDRAKQLSQRVSVLNRVLRHDIRRQAQLLHGYVDRLEHGDLTVPEAAEKITATNERLVELSADASQLQKLFDGADLENEAVDLVDLVRSVGADVTGTHDRLTVEYDLPDEQFVVAPPMFAQAVEQLLSNVVEHAGTAEPRAEVTVTTHDTAEPSVELTVADNGPGMPTMELIHTTSEQESQLHHSKGMGLWLVTWIVEEAGGRLDIETDPPGEVGTVVSVWLCQSG